MRSYLSIGALSVSWRGWQGFLAYLGPFFSLHCTQARMLAATPLLPL
jgi:hypothetical protein